MKLILLTVIWISIVSPAIYAQENKSTIDRVLETTSGILNLLDKNGTQPKESSTVEVAGKFSIVNSTGKRLSVNLKSVSQSISFDKTVVLGIDDRETIPNLKLGAYAYTAKFEDGSIAKSGDVEFTKDILLFEKVVK